MKLTYLNVANQAAQAEREGDYLRASQLWNKAKDLATNNANSFWAECRAEHSEKCNLISIRASKKLERVREANNKYRERKRTEKEAELLKINIINTSKVNDEQK